MQPEYQTRNAWCDDCHGYTHMPWCSEYEEPVVIHGGKYAGEYKPVPSTEQPASTTGSESSTAQRAIAYLVLNGVVNAGQYWPDEIVEWARQLMTGEPRCGVELVRLAIADHNQHQQHAAQLRFLGNRAEELSSLLAGMTTERDELQEALRQVRSSFQIALDEPADYLARKVAQRWLAVIDAALNNERH